MQQSDVELVGWPKPAALPPAFLAAVGCGVFPARPLFAVYPAIVEYCPYLATGRLDLIPSLRGLYFMDGNPLLDEVVSFAGVGGGPAECW